MISQISAWLRGYIIAIIIIIINIIFTFIKAVNKCTSKYHDMTKSSKIVYNNERKRVYMAAMNMQIKVTRGQTYDQAEKLIAETVPPRTSAIRL